jgi:hypothetical protein
MSGSGRGCSGARSRPRGAGSPRRSGSCYAWPLVDPLAPWQASPRRQRSRGKESRRRRRRLRAQVAAEDAARGAAGHCGASNPPLGSGAVSSLPGKTPGEEDGEVDARSASVLGPSGEAPLQAANPTFGDDRGACLPSLSAGHDRGGCYTPCRALGCLRRSAGRCARSRSGTRHASGIFPTVRRDLLPLESCTPHANGSSSGVRWCCFGALWGLEWAS